MKTKVTGFLLWLGFVAVSVYLVGPWFMDALLGIEHVTTLGAYRGHVEAMPDIELEKAWADARAYNRKIRERQAQCAFTYLGEKATDPEYQSLLCFQGDNTMGGIRVPSAGIDLPIAHGTENKYLDFEAGHLYGTSLPVGGEGTHAVIAGHTGLRNADIFTHLGKVREGDLFYVRVLDRELAYRVFRVKVVLPEEEDPFLQVEPGRDLVTLYTCTPYGVNSHRLLVAGERDPEAENLANDGAGASSGLTYVRRDLGAILRCIGCGCVPAVVATAADRLIFGKKRKMTGARCL